MVELSLIVDGIDFQGDEINHYLNMQTGHVIMVNDEDIHTLEGEQDISELPKWFQEIAVEIQEFLDNPDQYLELPDKYDLDEYQIMTDFIYSLPKQEQKQQLLILIDGKGAFSRFKQGVERYNLLEDWYAYKFSAIAELAKNWCQDNDIKYIDDTKNKIN